MSINGAHKMFHIVLSANERYMPGALVSAAGVAVCAGQELRLHFCLFSEGVKDESFEFLKATLKWIHENTEVSRYECDERLLARLPYWAGSRMADVRCHHSSSSL